MLAVVSFLCGLLFAFGLGLSGMTRPENVIAFLDITGDWNPALAFVMVGAIGVHGLAYPFVTRRDRPVLEAQFFVPQKKRVDWRLVAGAVLFGVGWALGGYCPGPALTSLASFHRESLIFVGCMLLGMSLFHFSFSKK